MSNRSRNNIKPKTDKMASQVTVKTEQQFFSGPIPHPMALAKYDEIVPGAADRIIRMAEKQSEHRIETEKKVIDSKIKDGRLGMILGFIIAIVLTFFGGAAIYMDKDLIGITSIITAIGGLVGAFIYGTNSNRKERENKS